MKQKGFSLLELMFSLAIALPLSITLSAVLHSLGQAIPRSRDTAAQGVTLTKILIMLERTINDLDSHVLPIFPIAHKNGEIRFASGQRNRVHNAHGKAKPHPKSDALTYAAIDMTSMQTVRSWEQTNNNSITSTACARFGFELNKDKHRSVLGLSTNGFTEYVLDWKRSISLDLNAKTFCYQLTLRKEDSMLVAPLIDAYMPYFLIPVSDLYTYYIDRENQLRFLSHVGSQNIENQPIAKHILQMHFRKEAYDSQKPLCLNLQTSQVEDKFQTFTKCNRIARTTLQDILINRP